MKRIAALDLGSNTFLLTIADLYREKESESHRGIGIERKPQLSVQEGAALGKIKIHQVLCDETEVVRLGQGVDKTQCLHPEALQRVDACFQKYSQFISQYNAEVVVSAATSAARDAKNSQELFALGEKYKIPIQVIPGEEEAAVTYLGATFEESDTEGVLVLDIGGGSTELMAQVEASIFGHSLNIGSVRLLEKIVESQPISRRNLQQLDEFILNEIKQFSQQIPQKSDVQKMIAVAGTPTTLAMIDQQIEFSEEKVHNYKLSFDRVSYWRERLAQMSVEERQQLPGMPANRADVIAVGASILLKVMESYGLSECKVSTKGVRYGLLMRAGESLC